MLIHAFPNLRCVHEIHCLTNNSPRGLPRFHLSLHSEILPSADNFCLAIDLAQIQTWNDLVRVCHVRVPRRVRRCGNRPEPLLGLHTSAVILFYEVVCRELLVGVLDLRFSFVYLEIGNSYPINIGMYCAVFTAGKHVVENWTATAISPSEYEWYFGRQGGIVFCYLSRFIGVSRHPICVVIMIYGWKSSICMFASGLISLLLFSLDLFLFIFN